jgi:hypothetical protein
MLIMVLDVTWMVGAERDVPLPERLILPFDVYERIFSKTKTPLFGSAGEL